MDSKDVLKFHAIYYVEGEKVRLTAELITGDPQQIDIEVVLLHSHTVYKGSMTDEMCDVVAVLEMLRLMQASLHLVEEGMLLRCSPIKILLTPTEDELDFKELRLDMIEESLECSNEHIRECAIRIQSLEDKINTLLQKTQLEPQDNSKSEFLTNHVWPKSRMLLAIVSRMYKEGKLDSISRGKLKDLIIDEDPRLLQSLQQYEMDGDRRVLYSSFLKLASN